ncbi:hypothetical protein FLONG3_7057 [Fusarium longipes]|uniref:2EXR domain-containing protein n=1 Tax=Fusarium longipes TaxID=694270 RepID=A0A395SHP7_9HYPO|nr:hypothetical protein FLONG3_7057 [Fusarium longipes]
MAPPHFHQFPRLPAELRLQIWETACSTYGTSYPNLQYVNIQDGEVSSIPWSKGKGNKSAYLIDGGLWRACKEPRQVIARHSHFDYWLRIQRKSFGNNGLLRSSITDNSGGYEAGQPAIIDASKTEEECRVLVYPASDIFCIQMDDWQTLKSDHSDDPSSQDDVYIYMSSLRCESHLRDLKTKNIAFEYDSSWLTDMPRSRYDCMLRETSARSCLVYLFYEKANPLSMRGVDIWIVDNEAKWFKDPSQQHETVYRDCDSEYIEIKWRDCADRWGDGPDVSAYAFEKIVRNMYPHNGLSRPTRHLFKLLVRRHNEVKRTTSRCKKECRRMGWCSCN